MSSNSIITKDLRNFSLVLLWVCLIAWPAPATAEFYRYYDENGMLRFTDDISVIPEDQRLKIISYDEENDYLSPEEQAAKARAERRMEQLDIHDRKASTIRKAEINSPDDLEGVREELDEDFENLQKRREALQAERDTMTTPEEIRAHQQRVRTLNEDIELFEKRRQEFVKKAEEFNALSN